MGHGRNERRKCLTICTSARLIWRMLRLMRLMASKPVHRYVQVLRIRCVKALSEAIKNKQNGKIPVPRHSDVHLVVWSHLFVPYHTRCKEGSIYSRNSSCMPTKVSVFIHPSRRVTVRCPQIQRIASLAQEKNSY